MIIGSDEVGWGAVAGPLYVVGVAMPRSWKLKGLRDSKKLSKKTREALFEPLLAQVRGHWALAVRSPEQIDRLGAQRCLLDSHLSVVRQLVERFSKENIEDIIVDGNIELPIAGVTPIPHADDLFQVVSAASVLAKVLRDDLMTTLAETYPKYGFQTNMGYGVAAHRKAIKKYGLCPIHRRSYLKEFVTTR